MPPKDTIGQIVDRLKPFVFMLMPFSDWSEFERVRDTVRESVDLPCYTADDIKASGYNICEKVYASIDRAVLVIADVTSSKPNVMHEVGYAIGKGKDPLLIVREGSDVSSNLDGLERITYGGRRETNEAFPRNLREHLKVRLSEVGLFKEMLESDAPHPAYIVAHPAHPGPKSKVLGQVWDFRTFGDNLGILGLISAFGLMWGEPRNVELISAKFHAPKLSKDDLNLYLIGSGKVNPIVPTMLEQLQKGREPKWELVDRVAVAAPEGDAYMRLYRTVDGKREELQGKLGRRGYWKQDLFIEDYGILVRGPHPRHPDRLVLVMAGPHSVGTGAACLAATRSLFIRQIKEMLPEGTLADKRRAFWVLVKGKLNRPNGMLDMDGVNIEEAGVYDI